MLVAILCIPYIAENYRVMRDISCFLVDFAVENPVLQEYIKLANTSVIKSNIDMHQSALEHLKCYFVFVTI